MYLKLQTEEKHTLEDVSLKLYRVEANDEKRKWVTCLTQASLALAQSHLLKWLSLLRWKAEKTLRIDICFCMGLGRQTKLLIFLENEQFLFSLKG